MEPTPEHHSEEKLETALERVLSTLPDATPQQRAFLLKRAGDLCVGMDERRKALGWYGRAVDQCLELGDARQATLLCRLIVHVQPEAVRARCTLTWIALGTDHEADAAEHLRTYVNAALHAGQTALAARQLEWMFAATHSPALRLQLVEAMRALGEPARADALEAHLGDPLPTDQAKLWARVLEATIGPAASVARLTS